VLQGIQLVQDQRISVTKQSINIIKEYRNYLWQTDKDGKVINEPEGIFNHSMDSLRYAITNIGHIQERNYRQPSRPVLGYGRLPH
jgi:phage terminase large subunit